MEYQLDPVDPEPEKHATKPTLSVSDAPTAETQEATQADTPTTTPPAEGSAANPSKNVIRVVNDWVGKVLNIRLSNVNIKQDHNSTHADKKKEEYEYNVSGMIVKGSGDTKIELDGKNVLDSTDASGSAGLYKDDGEGWLTITDETDDEGNMITDPKSGDSGSLTAKTSDGNNGAAIGGVCGKSTKNIIIEGYATVKALSSGNDGAGIGGGGTTGSHKSGDAENIIIRGHSNVTATAGDGAAIGGGSTFGSGDDYHGGSAKGIQIYGHATVNARTNGEGAAIGAAGHTGDNTKAEVTIGKAGATADEEDVHVTATSKYGAAIGNGKVDTNVIIQGNTTIENASSEYGAAIGGAFTAKPYYGNTTIDIKDTVVIKNAEGATKTSYSSAIGGAYTKKIVVNIGGKAHLCKLFGGIGSGTDVEDTTVNIGGNTKIDTIESKTVAIGGKSDSGKTVIVNINGGENGNVELGDVGGISGVHAVISGTKINIGDHVRIKMKQGSWNNYARRSQYVSENNAEKELTSVSGVSDNTTLWYTDCFNHLQKIVHGKNFCKKK